MHPEIPFAPKIQAKILLLVWFLIGQKVQSADVELAQEEVVKYFKNEGILQAHTLHAHADAVKLNPLLFEDAGDYSLHYGTVPFEVFHLNIYILNLFTINKVYLKSLFNRLSNYYIILLENINTINSNRDIKIENSH